MSEDQIELLRVELPEWESGRLSLADLALWQSLVGHYFYFKEDPTGHDEFHNELWILGDVELDFSSLGYSQLCFHRAKGASSFVHRAWTAWGYRDFEVVTKFSREHKKYLLEHLGFVPEGWKR